MNRFRCVITFLALLLVARRGYGQTAHPVNTGSNKQFQSGVQKDASLKNLVQRLQSGNMDIDTALAEADYLFRDVLNGISTDSRSSDYARAIEAYAGYRHRARKIIPDLLRIAESKATPSVVQDAAIRTLGSIGDDDISVRTALARIATDSSVPDSTIIAAVRQMGNMSGSYPEFTPALVHLLQRPETTIAYDAFCALGEQRIRRHSMALQECVEILAQYTSASPEDVSGAFLALTRMGSRAEEAAPLLFSLLEHVREPYLRAAALDTLDRTNTLRGVTALKIVLKEVADRDSRVADMAQKKLQPWGILDRPSQNVLVNALLDTNYTIRRIAAANLASNSEVSNSELPKELESKLAEAIRREPFNSPSVIYRLYAQLMYQLHKKSPQIAQAFLSHLDSDTTPSRSSLIDPQACTFVLLGLSFAGTPSNALPIVQHYLFNSHQSIVAAAIRVAGQLGSTASTTTARLKAILASNTPELLLDRLCTPLETDVVDRPGPDEITSSKMEAIRTLRKIGAPSSIAIPELRHVASEADENPYKKQMAIEASQTLDILGDTNRIPYAHESAFLTNARLSDSELRISDCILTDLQDVSHTVQAFKGQTLVLCFVDTKCPCVAAYDARIRDLQSRYSSRGVRIVYVYSASDETARQVEDAARNRRYTWAVMRDPSSRLMHALHVRVTTEAFVFDSDLKIKYHGRIDDSIYSPEAATHHDLADAIDAVLAKKQILHPETRALGCPIASSK